MINIYPLVVSRNTVFKRKMPTSLQFILVLLTKVTGLMKYSSNKFFKPNSTLIKMGQVYLKIVLVFLFAMLSLFSISHAQVTDSTKTDSRTTSVIELITPATVPV